MNRRAMFGFVASLPFVPAVVKAKMLERVSIEKWDVELQPVYRDHRGIEAVGGQDEFYVYYACKYPKALLPDNPALWIHAPVDNGGGWKRIEKQVWNW